jgi:hypothetical protein
MLGPPHFLRETPPLFCTGQEERCSCPPIIVWASTGFVGLRKSDGRRRIEGFALRPKDRTSHLCEAKRAAATLFSSFFFSFFFCALQGGNLTNSIILAPRGAWLRQKSCQEIKNPAKDFCSGDLNVRPSVCMLKKKWYGTTQYHGIRQASPCCWLPVSFCSPDSAGHKIGMLLEGVHSPYPSLYRDPIITTHTIPSAYCPCMGTTLTP